MFSTAQSFSKTLDGIKLQLEFGEGCERAFNRGSDTHSRQKLGEELVGYAKCIDEDLAKLIAGIAFLAMDAPLQKRATTLLHQMRHRLRQGYPLSTMVDDGAEDVLDEWEINIGTFAKLKAKFFAQVDDLVPLVAAHEAIIISAAKRIPTKGSSMVIISKLAHRVLQLMLDADGCGVDAMSKAQMPASDLAIAMKDSHPADAEIVRRFASNVTEYAPAIKVLRKYAKKPKPQELQERIENHVRAHGWSSFRKLQDEFGIKSRNRLQGIVDKSAFLKARCAESRVNRGRPRAVGLHENVRIKTRPVARKEEENRDAALDILMKEQNTDAENDRKQKPVRRTI